MSCRIGFTFRHKGIPPGHIALAVIEQGLRSPEATRVLPNLRKNACFCPLPSCPRLARLSLLLEDDGLPTAPDGGAGIAETGLVDERHTFARLTGALYEYDE